jgi:hypothetical protein
MEEVMSIEFVRWSSARQPAKVRSDDRHRNHSMWHLTDNRRSTFCGRMIHRSAAPVKPEYAGAKLFPLQLSPYAESGRGICHRCAVSEALWKAIKRASLDAENQAEGQE